MSNFLVFMFIFFIGSVCGWITELFYNRVVNKKWINPGFLVGPYLPIHGFGLCILSCTHILLSNYDVPILLVSFIMCFLLTLLEYITGIILICYGKIKLWDYSHNWGNIKGIICPLYSFFWTIIGLLYYYFLADYIMDALRWFSENLSFSFVLGIFFGTIVIDTIYSTKIFKKIRKFAKENKILIKYEEFKSFIQNLQKRGKEKYSFVFAFKQTKSLKEYLTDYFENKKNK